MTTTVFAVLGGLLLAAMLRSWLGPSVHKEAARAGRTRDPQPLFDLIARQKPSSQPAAFNQAIRQLWDRYERDVAAVVARELAEKHPDARITQYWLDQIQKVEPELAQKAFDHRFLQAHYRPEVAASCGNVG